MGTSKMSQIQFAHVAREWRMKYQENELKGGAAELDKILQEKYLDTIKATKGFVSCQRAVCGGCNDFKVVVKLSVPEFGDWEKGGFVPEAESWLMQQRWQESARSRPSVTHLSSFKLPLRMM